MIGADAAHATATGAGATIAIVDSGAQADHPDLTGRLLRGHDLVDGDGTPQDGAGHGTHVTGIAGAATGNGAGIASVAPGAKLLPVRVLDDAGAGDEATVARGIDWAREHGADVINLSLGSDVPLIGAAGGDETDAAIRRALTAGVVVVAAAGNNGVPVCEQPAASAGPAVRGAVHRRGQRSFFSSFGSGLAVMAPGGSSLPGTDEDVLSTYPPGGYEALAGTSQAAPHVAGVAALLVGLGVRGRAAADRILATAPPTPGPRGSTGSTGTGSSMRRPRWQGSEAAPARRPPRRAPASRGARCSVCPRASGSGARIRVRVRSVAGGRVRVRAVRAGARDRPRRAAGGRRAQHAGPGPAHGARAPGRAPRPRRPRSGEGAPAR